MPPAALKTLCLCHTDYSSIRLSPPSTDSNMRLSVFISLFTCCGSFAFRTNIPLLSSTSAFSRYASRCSASSSSSNNRATSASSFHDHFEKGRRAEKKGKLASAREHFLRALIHKWAVQKEFVGAVEFRLASVQAERGDAEEAVDLYRLSMDHWPELATCCDAQNCLGLALEEAGCTGDALQAYSAAISCEPWRPEPHGNLANVLWELGEIAAAEKELRVALELSDIGPFKVKLLFNLQMLLEEAERNDEAHAVHEWATQLSPPELKSVDAWRERDGIDGDSEQCLLFSSSSERCIMAEDERS